MNTLQQKAYDIALSGDNLFLTGVAGSGKSFTLRHIIKKLKNIKNVSVTASTGTASFLIDGITLHKWLGLGLANEPIHVLREKLTKKKMAQKNIRTTNVLIIDEISMISGELLDKVDQCCRFVRKCNKPFGGIQVIFCGDMAQLPPVSGNHDENTIIKNDLPDNHIDYPFYSNAWNDSNVEYVYLTQIIRQKDDHEFSDILRGIREGNLHEDMISRLYSIIGKRWNNEDEIYPTQLVPTNKLANDINKKEYKKIQSTQYIYKAYVRKCISKFKTHYASMLSNIGDGLLDNYKKNGINPIQIQLKKGTRVILTHNIDVEKGFYNGAQGTIIGFEECNTIPYPSSIENKDDYDIHAFHYNSKNNENSNQEKTNVLPVVRFQCNNTLIVKPINILLRSDLSKCPDVLVEYCQLPLRYAWALTIHKSQGMTLDRARIDAGTSIFTAGQTYTALSRVRNLNSLSLIDFDPEKIHIDPIINEFYRRIVHQEPMFSPIPIERVYDTNAMTDIFSEKDLTPDLLNERIIKLENNYINDIDLIENTRNMLLRKIEIQNKKRLELKYNDISLFLNHFFKKLGLDIDDSIEKFDVYYFKNGCYFQRTLVHENHCILYNFGNQRNISIHHKHKQFKENIIIKKDDMIVFTKQFLNTFDIGIPKMFKQKQDTIIMSICFDL